MRILIIRHAEPDYSVDSLTPKGRREAELLADRLCGMGITDFFVSPLGRARETAAVTLRRLGREAETMDWLQEFRGVLINPKTGERQHAWDLMPQYWTRCPELMDREAWRNNPLLATGNAAQIARETDEALDALLARFGFVRDGLLYRTERNTDACLALFCHFGIGMVLMAHLTHLPLYPLLQGMIMAPSSVTELVTEERLPGEVCFRCTMLGDTSHLYAGREPISHYGRFRELHDVPDPLSEHGR